MNEWGMMIMMMMWGVRWISQWCVDASQVVTEQCTGFLDYWIRFIRLFSAIVDRLDGMVTWLGVCEPESVQPRESERLNSS